jgi:hypothetical protein
MLTSFLMHRSKINVKLFPDAAARGLAVFNKEKGSKGISEGQAALNHVDELYKKKQYIEALREITKIEEKYPGCSKAAKYYRGKVSYAYLEKTGDLKNIGPSI